jgi:hypothetical protein
VVDVGVHITRIPAQTLDRLVDRVAVAGPVMSLEVLVAPVIRHQQLPRKVQAAPLWITLKWVLVEGVEEPLVWLVFRLLPPVAMELRTITKQVLAPTTLVVGLGAVHLLGLVVLEGVVIRKQRGRMVWAAEVAVVKITPTLALAVLESLS